MTKPLTDEALAHAKKMLAELHAGHPSYKDKNREELLPWQREQYNIWALNLESCLAPYVGGLIERVEVDEAVLRRLRDGWVAFEILGMWVKNGRDEKMTEAELEALARCDPGT